MPKLCQAHFSYVSLKPVLLGDVTGCTFISQRSAVQCRTWHAGVQRSLVPGPPQLLGRPGGGAGGTEAQLLLYTRLAKAARVPGG